MSDKKNIIDKLVELHDKEVTELRAQIQLLQDMLYEVAGFQTTPDTSQNVEVR